MKSIYILNRFIDWLNVSQHELYICSVISCYSIISTYCFFNEGENLIDTLVITQLIRFLISLQVTKSNTNPDDLGGLANQLTNEFGNLANEAKYAAVTAENDEVKKTNRTSARHFLPALHVSLCIVFMLLHQIYVFLFVSRLVLTLRSRWVSWVSAAQVW